MKNIFLVIIFAFFTTGSLFAQETNKIEDANYCILLDGKVFAQKDGKISQIKEAITLHDKTVVHPDGSYVLTDNSKAQLKDGACLGFSGKLYENQEALNKALLKKYKKLKK